MEVSSHRYFLAKQRSFSPGNFCTLCRILQRKAPSARFETVQNPCRNRALTLRQIKSPYPHRLDGIGLSGRTARSGSLSRAFPLRTDLALFQRFSYEKAILGKAGARGRHDNAVIACGRTPEQEVPVYLSSALFSALLRYCSGLCPVAFAKRVEKLLASPKPTFCAISLTLWSVRTSSSFACVMRKLTR